MTEHNARADQFMRLAVEQARLAVADEHLPIGAVVVADDVVVAQSGTIGKPLAHAELSALMKLDYETVYSGKRLEVYTTLEPCLMCSGAALNTNVGAIYYMMAAAPDGSVWLNNTGRYRDELGFGERAVPDLSIVQYKSAHFEELMHLLRAFLAQHEGHFAYEYMAGVYELN